jgi:uncharacterized protein (DUF2062 family)
VRFLRRHYFRRFLSPINRMKLTPETVGRTCLFGLMWGLSPTVGVQVAGLALTWLVVDKGLDRPFNFPIALVLTGVTNPLTVVPIYGLYFAVGCRAVSCDISEYQVQGVVRTIAELDVAGLFARSFDAIAIPLAITLLGSLPFVAAGAFAGWYFGRKLGDRLQHRRHRRERKRGLLRRRRPAADQPPRPGEHGSGA